MTTEWQHFFHARQFLSLRKGRGPRDHELAVTDSAEGPRLALWDVDDDRLTPLDVDFGGSVMDAVLTTDGRSVLTLRDDNGSEVGHVWRTALDGTAAVDLTPDLPPYVLRGIDTARVGNRIVLTTVSDDGFHLWLVDDRREAAARLLYRSANEAWDGVISADGCLAALDTTDHNPGVRRFAVTVTGIDDESIAVVLSDGPDAPVRVVRFSPVPGDARLLVSTERTGFARPCVWNPLDGSRTDIDAPGLHGDLVALDWSPAATHVLAVHVDAGVHRVLEYELTTGELRAVSHPDGAYFEPDVAAVHQQIWASHYGAEGEIRLLHQRFDQPLSVLRVDAAGTHRLPLSLDGAPASAPEGGTPLHSYTVVSADGTPVQLWAARPRNTSGPVPLVLRLHGGPNMVTVDRYSPESQAFLASGIAYASLNYRGSVTFGRDFREGFLGVLGDHEIEDIQAAAAWLLDEGFAHKDQLFITGISYGGFLTLLSVGRLPDLFAGGLAFVPLGDWVSAYEDMNPAQRVACRQFHGGTPDEVPERYRRASPITYVQDVRAPVWICQATHDTRTPPAQALGYARALEKAGGDSVVEWFDGGHETSSRTLAIADHDRMLTLIRAALRGERWARGPGG
ncbi:prolyl oligopeptidase family serine peptidase [Streptomyces sp. NPDC002499]